METRSFIKKVIPYYIHHRNYINKGNGEITTIRHIGMIVLGVKIAWDKVPMYMLIMLGVIIIFTLWYIGYTWDMVSGYQEEVEWSNKRNPTIAYIKNKV